MSESQKQEQDGGDDLAGDALQHDGPTGQLHQDTQADDAHLTVVKTVAGKRSVSVEPWCVQSGTGAGAVYFFFYYFLFRIIIIFIHPNAS